MAVELRSGHPFSGPGFAKGLYTAQDLAAQLTTQLLFAATEKGPLSLPAGAILDGCAGVGGKTCHVAALTQNQRKSTPSIGCRANWSFCAIMRTGSAARGFGRFVAICSMTNGAASGLCGGDSRRAVQWFGRAAATSEARLRPPNIDELVTLQSQLLDRAAGLVVPGGVLLYSVCSLFVPEGPLQIAAFLARHPDLLPLPPRPTIRCFSGPSPLCEKQAPFALRTLPHTHNADGFYAVRLLRTCTAQPTGVISRRHEIGTGDRRHARHRSCGGPPSCCKGFAVTVTYAHDATKPNRPSLLPSRRRRTLPRCAVMQRLWKTGQGSASLAVFSTEKTLRCWFMRQDLRATSWP